MNTLNKEFASTKNPVQEAMERAKNILQQYKQLQLLLENSGDSHAQTEAYHPEVISSAKEERSKNG